MPTHRRAWLARWTAALEGLGFDVESGDTMLTARRDLADGVETLALDRSGRLLLQRQVRRGVPASDSALLAGVEVRLVLEQTQTIAAQWQVSPDWQPADALAGLLARVAAWEQERAR